jgi:hypothetical protein
MLGFVLRSINPMEQIDTRGKVQIIKVGNEHTPVIIIDDFSPEIQNCIALAIKEEFTPNTESDVYYPGVRAMIGGDYGNTVLRSIVDVIRSVYKIAHPNTLIPHAGFYSLICNEEKDLDLLQTLPHFDSVQPNYFAVMHYLNPGEFGGTGIYRHNPTGFENITESRVKPYLTSAQNFIDQQDKIEMKYFTESTEHFELIEKLEYKQNRLVIYPGTLLHSGFIDNCERDLSSDPITGRLTANFFIYFQ